MEEIIYNSNKIIKYGDNDFVAFLLNEDDDIINKRFNNIKDAKKWIDSTIDFLSLIENNQ